MQHAVDAVADPHVALGGLDVDVGGAVADRLVDEEVHEPHDRCLVVDLGEAVEVVGLLLGREVRGEVVQLALGPVDLVDPGVDVAAVGDGEPDPAAGQSDQVVLELDVAGLAGAHRDDELAVVEGERQYAGTAGELGRQQVTAAMSTMKSDSST